MDILEAISARHSVRHYTDQVIETEKIERLQQLVNEYNAQSGLHIQLITNEPRSFGESLLARYGKFSGVTCYFAMIGNKSDSLDETVGYYGEKLVLEAQMMGLNTCWVGLSYKKIGSVLDINKDEKLVCLISLGYGATQGVDHKRKSPEKVSKTDVMTAPQWYQQGIGCALLAPTAINQQKFKFELKPGNKVAAKAGFGPYAKVDLGIVKYHFEIGAGTENFEWE
ncbi:MAG: nitroreductase family protein [Muribaculaceae bacterium]|nr:nitroreductase family protein [Muribaculaceae bacterium]